MLFWTRRTYCFLLCLSSNLAGVLPFRNRALGGVSAAESPTVLDGKASIPHPSISLQLFAFSWLRHVSLSNSLLLAGSKVLKGPFTRLSRLGCAVCGLSFLLLRGLQRCCFGPAERTVFCCA